jgi:hypothetical protein
MDARDRITEALMRFFLPNTYGGGTPQQGAPNPFTPPLWRDPDNPDDPLNRSRLPPDPRMQGWKR